MIRANTRERNHPAHRSRARPERVTVSRDAVVVGQSSNPPGRSPGARARTHTHTNNSLHPIHTQTHEYPITTIVWTYRAHPPRRRRVARVAQSKRGVCVKSPVMIRRLRVHARFFRCASSSSSLVFESSIGRTTARTRANGGTSEKIKKKWSFVRTRGTRRSSAHSSPSHLISSHSFHWVERERANGRTRDARAGT